MAVTVTASIQVYGIAGDPLAQVESLAGQVNALLPFFGVSTVASAYATASTANQSS